MAKKKKTKNIYKGSYAPDDPVYQEGWSVHVGPLGWRDPQAKKKSTDESTKPTKESPLIKLLQMMPPAQLIAPGVYADEDREMSAKNWEQIFKARDEGGEEAMFRKAAEVGVIDRAEAEAYIKKKLQA